MKEECRFLERMCDFGEGYEGGTFWWWGGGAAMGWLTDRWSVMMQDDCGRADWLDGSTRVPSRVYGYPFVRQSTKTQLGDQFYLTLSHRKLRRGFGMVLEVLFLALIIELCSVHFCSFQSRNVPPEIRNWYVVVIQ